MAPVVSAALGALGPLLVKLAGLVAGEYGRLKGVGREIRSLQAELTSMHAALEEYTELEDPSGQVKAWISLVRELAYDTEDVFDKFIHQLRKGCRRGGFKEFLHKITLPLKNIGCRRGIADQIDNLKVRIKQVKELKDCYKLNDAISSTTRHVAVDPRLHAVFVDEAQLVGVEGPRDDLVQWMVDGNNSSNHCKVLSIVGFGGLGKTTLANAIYHKIQAHFDCWAFVSVSQKPDIKKIIKEVISQVSSEDGSTKDTSDWDENKFIAKLRELLQDKRYLVIIDDVWSIDAWTTIKCAFPENNNSSRIIATTRITDVAKSCCLSFDGRMYEMEALSDVHSRRLFFKRIFGSENNCPDMLKEVSSEILKKCGGLPLAIISISSLLASRPAVKEEWEKVKRSIGYALEKNKSLEGMHNILSLSYNDLPPNLKTCLLYLSVFPEDYEIDRETLVRRWIAEGFICEVRGKNQYEVAESYFYELINKSMVQPVGLGYDDNVRACRVHDMILEIIISKSAEDNFVTVVGGGQTSLLNRDGIIRRLSIQHIDKELACALANEDLSHVRSLTVTASDCIKHLPNLAEFEALRVLDFEGCVGLGQYDMNSVEKLFQLKYLGLKDTGISKLPSRIVMLSDLETLDFRNTSVQELPAGFVQLTELQNLLAGGQTKIPSGIGIMTNLRIISHFNATMSPADALEELGDLTRLNAVYLNLNCKGSQLLAGKRVKITSMIGNMRNLSQLISSSNAIIGPPDALEELGNLSRLSELIAHSSCGGSECAGPDVYRTHEEKLFASLHKLIGSNELRSLSIHSADSHSLEFLESWSPMPSALQMFRMSTNYHFTNIPKWIAPTLTSLASLDINLTKLTDDGLHTLGELPALLYLILMVKTREDRITVEGIGFRSLKYFKISEVKGMYITFMKGAMPKLEYLALKLDVSVGRSIGFSLGIMHLPCLKKVVADVWGPTGYLKKLAASFRGDTSSEMYEIDAAVAAINEEVAAHTNHPSLVIY